MGLSKNPVVCHGRQERMNAAMGNTRREIIRAMLAEKPYVTLKELGERFPELSTMTLRRDIEYFEEQGDCIRVRGGARSMKFITSSMEESFNLRLRTNSSAKESIAKYAASMIEPGRSIFMDSGTTMLKLAAMIRDERLTITTSGPNVALELMKKNMPIVNVVGGMINRDNISVSGTQALRYMEDINIDIAFLTPSGLTLENGFTCGNYSECEFKQQIIRKARMVVLTMDHSKVDKSLPYTFAHMGDVAAVLTNRDFPPDIAALAKERGTQILVATRED